MSVGWVPPGELEGESIHASLLYYSGHQKPLASLGYCTHHFNLPLSSQDVLSVCKSSLPLWLSLLSFIRTPFFIFRVHPNLAWLYLSQLHLQWPCLQIRSHAEIMGRCDFGRKYCSTQYTSHLSEPGDSNLYPPSKCRHTIREAQLISAHSKKSCKRRKWGKMGKRDQEVRASSYKISHGNIMYTMGKLSIILY